MTENLTQFIELENKTLKLLLDCLQDNQAIDIISIDIRKETSITDYMVIASGRSSRHVKAIASKIMETAKVQGISMLSAHGLETGDWVLIDFGDYVLHIMQPATRSFYDLEGLWQDN